MTRRGVQLQLGIGACVAALFLILVAIPTWISSPSNVGNVILSPLFWPYVLSGLTGLVGLGLVLTGWRMKDDGEPVNEPNEDGAQAWIRLGGMAVIMTATMLVMSTVGMVWTAMLAFAATAFLVRTRHPKTALICAVAVPLILYAFFAHVAGVAIPQGDFVRLP